MCPSSSSYGERHRSANGFENPISVAASHYLDEQGAWLATRLPQQRINARAYQRGRVNVEESRTVLMDVIYSSFCARNSSEIKGYAMRKTVEALLNRPELDFQALYCPKEGDYYAPYTEKKDRLSRRTDRAQRRVYRTGMRAIEFMELTVEGRKFAAECPDLVERLRRLSVHKPLFPTVVEGLTNIVIQPSGVILSFPNALIALVLQYIGINVPPMSEWPKVSRHLQYKRKMGRGKSAANKSAANKSAANKSAANKSAANKSAANKSAAKKTQVTGRKRKRAEEAKQT
jgi:hypothetical protein